MAQSPFVYATASAVFVDPLIGTWMDGWGTVGPIRFETGPCIKSPSYRLSLNHTFSLLLSKINMKRLLASLLRDLSPFFQTRISCLPRRRSAVFGIQAFSARETGTDAAPGTAFLPRQDPGQRHIALRESGQTEWVFNGKMTQLDALSLSGNQFTGLIPSSVANLTRLSQLKLGNNLLSGPIPPGISKLTKLSFLSLQNNKLTGPIPDFFSSFTDLRILELSHNRFSGKIPNSIASLAPKLAYLELGHNALTGTIPSFLGMFKALDTLDLSWNNFTQTVPKSFGNLKKIFNLDLSHNSLVDPFPVMNVTGIESLDLSYNRFNLKQIPNWVTSSPIIYSLKLAKCGIKMSLNDWKPKQTYFYDYIDLSYNEISGSPVWLLNKTDYLVGFSASGNKLRFDLGSLKIAGTLTNLELSRNLVYGKVPKSVSGLTSLNLSYNHLCGQLPPTKFPAGAFVGNDCLCGSPLPPCKVKGK
uniref:Leucine-rich repeat-containing N-terminal plant-type domain-containing protein n=1 Tax=Salix viminalis TaxID=40686 RepID=A0A6N2MBX5_SALVM